MGGTWPKLKKLCLWFLFGICSAGVNCASLGPSNSVHSYSCDLQNFFGPEFVKMTIEPFISLDLPKSILVSKKGAIQQSWQVKYVKPTNALLSQV